MKSFLALAGICLSLSACQKETPGTEARPAEIASPQSTQRKIAVNPFGVIINTSEGLNLSIGQQMVLAKQLKAAYVRHALILASYDGHEPFQDSIKANGLKSVTNFNWMPTGAGASPFITASQLGAYTSALGAALDKYPPALVAIENEETNSNYHSGSMQQYISMLNAAIPVAHARGLKITNGGIIGAVINVLVWRNYLATGQSAAADDFARRAFPPALYHVLPYIPASLQAKVAQTDSLLTAYTSMQLDYINFHWYADTRQDGSATYVSSIDTNHLNTQSLKELVTYLNQRTGKPVITNEIGESYFSGGYVTDIMQAISDIKMPYCIWYSGDGDKRFQATALQNGQGALRASGLAYKQFTESHY